MLASFGCRNAWSPLSGPAAMVGVAALDACYFYSLAAMGLASFWWQSFGILLDIYNLFVFSRICIYIYKDPFLCSKILWTAYIYIHKYFSITLLFTVSFCSSVLSSMRASFGCRNAWFLDSGEQRYCICVCPNFATSCRCPKHCRHATFPTVF